MNEDFAILFVFFAISMTVNVSLAIAWFRAARRLRKLEDGKAAHTHADLADERLDRVEQLVEGLASQVDHLASSQEFVNRLIANKPGKFVEP